MAIVVENEEDPNVMLEQKAKGQQRKRLWGLVVCHHGSPRYLPFPLRRDCEFLAQVFAVHISKELKSEKRTQEKSILHMQSNAL